MFCSEIGERKAHKISSFSFFIIAATTLIVFFIAKHLKSILQYIILFFKLQEVYHIRKDIL
jgi:hypothetical protein